MAAGKAGLHGESRSQDEGAKRCGGVRLRLGVGLPLQERSRHKCTHWDAALEPAVAGLLMKSCCRFQTAPMAPAAGVQA